MVDGFFWSSIPVAHNAVKSFIFRCAELLMGIFIFKFFALAAARSSQFTSYLMFAEDLIQRCLFVFSRGFSRAALLVIVFTIFSTAASLYGTLLWALDSPGYVFRTFNSTLDKHENALNRDATYIVQLRLDPNTLDRTKTTLDQIVGSDLFKPAFNMSLNGDVKIGEAETAKRPEPAQLDGVGARIWLDDEGFSVSADTYVSIPNAFELDGHEFPTSCILFDQGEAEWNCTFDNFFASSLFEGSLGRPEVHWYDPQSLNNSHKIRPNRQDNVWASYGAGGGTAGMMQVFTVTKGKRRHTFAETFLRVTMLTDADVFFARDEVDDLVRRTAGPDATANKDDAFLAQIIDDMLSAQEKELSYNFGQTFNEDDKTVIQNSWSYFTPTVPATNQRIFSIIHMSSTKITLIRSEDIDDPPAPLEECDHPFQNEAFGGKLTGTTCTHVTLSTEGSRFYGTVDTAAVMILYGLGDPRSNLSSESLNQEVIEWVWDNTPRMMELLVARGFAVSVDPSLVGVTVQYMVVAVSGLQLFLSVLAAVLAIASWSALAFIAENGWTKSFLANLVHTALYRGTPESKTSYMKVPPNVDVVVHAEGDFVTVEGRPVVLYDPPVTPVVDIPLHHFDKRPSKEAVATGVAVGWGAPGYQYAPVPQ
jgi:hypothetical protein